MTSPPDSIAEIQRRIVKQHLELDSAMRGLRDAARRSLSPARWVGEHLEIGLFSALVVGIWLGRRRRVPRRRGWR